MKASFHSLAKIPRCTPRRLNDVGPLYVEGINTCFLGIFSRMCDYDHLSAKTCAPFCNLYISQARCSLDYGFCNRLCNFWSILYVSLGQLTPGDKGGASSKAIVQ